MRNSKTNLKKELLENAARFEFFEAARWLRVLIKEESELKEKEAAAKVSDFQDSGEGQDSGEQQTEELETVSANTIARLTKLRYRTSSTRSFPTGEVQRLKREDEIVELFTNVFGLFGPTGVLPNQDKDLVSGGEPSHLLREFLDVFNTRLISLFFDAWESNRQDIKLESFRRGINKKEDAMTMALLSLCGKGLPETRNQHRFSDDVFASSAGLLSRNVRSASSLRRCIANQFGVNVQIKEFVEERLYLRREIQTRLTFGEEGYNQLGKTAIAGESISTHRNRFEVKLGPLTRDEFESVCPYSFHSQSTIMRNESFLRLADLAKSILGRPLDFDIRLEVDADAVSGTQLGKTRLGCDSWVVEDGSQVTRDDPVFRFAWDQLGKLGEDQVNDTTANEKNSETNKTQS